MRVFVISFLVNSTTEFCGYFCNLGVICVVLSLVIDIKKLFFRKKIEKLLLNVR